MTEQDIARAMMYNNMLKVPHRDYKQAVTPFSQALEQDPLFVSRALVYFSLENMVIRDLADAAIITLLQSDPKLPGLREAGRCLLLGSEVYETDPSPIHGLPYYRFFRVMRYIAASNRKIPRMFKAIMSDFLFYIEASDKRLTNLLLYNRSDAKWAYTTTHRPPPALVQEVIFDKNPQEGSIFHTIKEIASCRDASRQADLLMDSELPYRIAQSLINKHTPETMIAMIALMTPQEALNSTQWVTKSGLLEMPEVRQAMEDKVSQATKSVASAHHRASAKTDDAGIAQAIDKAVQTATDTGARIKGNLLICVDRSGSMQVAIDVAKEVGMRVAPHVDGKLMVTVFNDIATEITVKDTRSVKGWNEAFALVKPTGYTSMGAPVEYAIKRGFAPTSGILIISDGEENKHPLLTDVVKTGELEYRIFHLYIPPRGGIGRTSSLGKRLERANIPFDEVSWQGDYNAFDQVVHFFSGEPVRSIAERIMEIDLPRRVK